MNNEDKAFLRWISKRLVYKYGEDKHVIDILESIIKKTEDIQSIFDDICQKCQDKITNQIQLSQEILNLLESRKDKISTKESELVQILISADFDNIDIDSILNSH